MYFFCFDPLSKKVNHFKMKSSVTTGLKNISCEQSGVCGSDVVENQHFGLKAWVFLVLGFAGFRVENGVECTFQTYFDAFWSHKPILVSPQEIPKCEMLMIFETSVMASEESDV